LRDLVLQVVWRSATVLQYAGLFLASLVPAVIVASRRSPATPGATRAHYAGAALALAWVLAAPALAPLVPVIEQASAARPRLMPSLPWLLPVLAPQLDRPLRLALSAASVVAGTALAWTLLRVLGRMGRLREWDPSMGLVAATGLCLFAMHAIYVQMNDTYVLVFLPFLVLYAGLVIRRSAAAARLLALTGGLSMLAVVVVALGMRGRFNHDEAAWKASDALLARGIQVSQIATIPTWLVYHGDFTEWVSRTYPVSLADRDERVRRSAGTFHASFFAWWDGRAKAADYRVYAVAPDRIAGSATGWAVVSQNPFRDAFLRRRLMIVEERPRQVPLR